MLRRWLLFAASIPVMGLAFPFSFFRKDERHFFARSFGLDTRLGAGDGDSVQEAFEDIGKDGRWLHSVKNVMHEWTRENPKRSAKFLCFLIVVLAALLTAECVRS